MKKILLTLSAVLATMGAANGQNFVSARMDAPVQAPAAEDDANWMKWCNEGAEFFYQFGAGTNSDFGLGSRFSKEILADYEGKSISLVAIYVAESMKDVSVELKKGDDITTAKDVATKEASYFAPGWNYVKFDEPVEIDATEAISLVYHAVVSANAFPAALDATPLSATADEGKAYCYYEGGFDDLATFTTSQGQRPYADLGHPVMKLFIGEDDQYLALNATMDMYNYVDRYVPNGEECDITVMFSNASFTTIDNVTLACEINGEKTEETITFSPALAANSMTQYSFKYTADKDYDISYSIAQINGETYSNEMNIPLNYAIQPYDASKTVDRTILIEKFTGQDCGFCPGGEQSIQAAIKGHEDRVARIDHHAGYYPGAEPLLLKLIYGKPDGRILGAQIVGKAGADKRIDAISHAIAMSLAADDLASLDMAYAPPYSSAKDPVNIAGYIASNKLSGLLDEFSYKDIDTIDPESSMLIDLRTPEETASGMIEGAVNIPLDELRDRLGEIDRSKTIYLYCRSGQRSYIGYRILKGHGFRAKSLSGGYLMYSYSRH